MKKEEFYFQWHFMNSCNLRCSHCYQEGYHYEDMPWEKLMIIANQITTALRKWNMLGRISLTGGEGTFDLLILECDTFALKRSQNLIHAREIISLCSGKIPIIAYGNYCYITKKNFDKADQTICSNDINILIDAVNAIATSTKVPQVTEYDSLPYIDRNLLLSMDYYLENRHSTLLQTAKGCENTCVFCQRKGWQGHYVPHSDSYVLDELAIIRNQGYRNVWITDENFTFNLVRAKRILSKMKQNGLTDGMKFFISSWANIDKELYCWIAWFLLYISQRSPSLSVSVDRRARAGAVFPLSTSSAASSSLAMLKILR